MGVGEPHKSKSQIRQEIKIINWHLATFSPPWSSPLILSSLLFILTHQNICEAAGSKPLYWELK